MNNPQLSAFCPQVHADLAIPLVFLYIERLSGSPAPPQVGLLANDGVPGGGGGKETLWPFPRLGRGALTRVDVGVFLHVRLLVEALPTELAGIGPSVRVDEQVGRQGG